MGFGSLYKRHHSGKRYLYVIPWGLAVEKPDFDKRDRARRSPGRRGSVLRGSDECSEIFPPIDRELPSGTLSPSWAIVGPPKWPQLRHRSSGPVASSTCYIDRCIISAEKVDHHRVQTTGACSRLFWLLSLTGSMRAQR